MPRAPWFERIPLHSIAGVFHLAFSADGRLGAVAEYHPKNLVPLAHLEHGGAFAYALTLFGADVGKPVEIPLDETGALRVAALRRGHRAGQVAHLRHLRRLGDGHGAWMCRACCVLFAAARALKPAPLPRSSASAQLCGGPHSGRPQSPRPDAQRDGRRLFVANRLEDTISVIDTRTNRVASTIALAGPKTVSVLRHGEQTFYSARYSFQGQIGCASCHIDSTFDGLTWDLEPDGFGRDIVDNKMLEGVKDTAPYKWNGGNPNLPTECGPADRKILLALGAVR